MEEKKILELMGEGISHGGEEAFISNLLSNIDMEGLHIDWLTPYKCNNQHYAEKLRERGGSIYELGLTYTPGKSRWHVIRPLNDFLQDHHYDVVHIHSGSTSILALASQAAYQHGVKKILVHSHSTGNNSIKTRLIKTAFSPMISKYPTDYLSCSWEAGAARFPAGYVKDRMLVIQNGIDLEKYKMDFETRAKIREKMDIPQNAWVIGHVGRFSPEKNHEFLIDVFKTIPQISKAVYLLLVGDGILLEQMKKKASDLGVKEHVRFAGFVNNVADYYKAMDLFAMPSVYEGFPIALIEAQAVGLPCIFSDTISGSVAVGKKVMSLPVKQPVEWSSAIVEHLGDGLSDNTAALLAGGFDIKKTASIIRNLYLN